MATQRITLHIGLHKTGTTYLQQVLRANRDLLAAQGVHVPGRPGQPNRTFAVYDLPGDGLEAPATSGSPGSGTR